MSGPAKIRLETPHYIFRTVELTDASEAWARWLTDAETARMLNARPQAVSVEQIRSYIASFDGHNRHLLGIFEKDDDRIVGFWALYIDWPSMEFTANVLIGEVAARGKGAREETRAVLYPHFFEVLGMRAIRCSVLAHNASTLRVMNADGWDLIDTNYKADVAGGPPIELRSYRLSRETWRARLGKKAARDGV